MAMRLPISALGIDTVRRPTSVLGDLSLNQRRRTKAALHTCLSNGTAGFGRHAVRVCHIKAGSGWYLYARRGALTYPAIAVDELSFLPSSAAVTVPSPIEKACVIAAAIE